MQHHHLKWFDEKDKIKADVVLLKAWQNGRSLIEGFQNMVARIEFSNNTSPFGASEVVANACTRYRGMIRDARVLETHIRDQIQLNAGNLSLQESRRSIRQADSVGRISFLAFVFFPVSLVCSFFGMNIQELTGSGVSWRVFFISAAALSGLVIVICAWLWRSSKRLWFVLLAPVGVCLFLAYVGLSSPGFCAEKMLGTVRWKRGITRGKGSFGRRLLSVLRRIRYKYVYRPMVSWWKLLEGFRSKDVSLESSNAQL